MQNTKYKSENYKHLTINCGLKIENHHLNYNFEIKKYNKLGII